mmetsp:Transcript_42283/g.131551  ORF Transcript_42283/g.131551 Transcript_42283/m.131551 type:complete len:80 (-) Transcript_42283:91-330(-)
MRKEKRWLASLVFLSSMVLTIVVAEASGRFHGRTLLLLLLVLLQWCAVVWYSLSFVPFGRQMACAGLRRCFALCAGSAD